jgi:hypothetical protein
VEVGARSENLTKRKRKMLEETYAEWSARAISELAALSNFPTETIYSRFGVVIVEGMSYVESTLAMLL